MDLIRLRGFQDLMGPEAHIASTVEEVARKVAELHGVNELRIPILERIELYERSTGETSDVVQKQLYRVPRNAESAGESDQALRPEGTPGVIRAYIEAGLDRKDPEQRFFYCGPMFRYERPQKGRLRQFNQFGIEILGRADAACDAELLVMIDECRSGLGLEPSALEFQINSLGDSKCRPAYREAVREWGRSNLASLCEDCHKRLERNPLRLLDCKVDAQIVQSAPRSTDYLCAECRQHFDTVQQLLVKALVPYRVNPLLVRGLDYYTRTTFEVVSGDVGSQSAVVAGGRYDGLVEMLGGAPVPGTGFALGVERLALAVAAHGKQKEAGPQVAVIALGTISVVASMELARRMREQNLRVETLSPERSLKALMRRADRIGARFAVILGEAELDRAVVQLRDLKASSQREIQVGEYDRVNSRFAAIDSLIDELKRSLALGEAERPSVPPTDPNRTH